MGTFIAGLIFCFFCLFASRADANSNNTAFGDFVWMITAIFGYVGYFGGGIFLWLAYEENLYDFFPWGLGIILITGGWAAGWFSDSEYKKMRREEVLEEIKNDGDNPTVLKIWGLIIIGFVIYLFFF